MDSLKWIQHIVNKDADFLDKSIKNFIGADKKQKIERFFGAQVLRLKDIARLLVGWFASAIFHISRKSVDVF